MTPEELVAMQTSMLELNEGLTPIFDQAGGMRADLERRGWSPTMAEQIAGDWLRSAMVYIWAHQP